MFRKPLSGLSLVALLATGAAAQLPFQESFQFQSTGVAGFNDYHATFNDMAGFMNAGEGGEISGLPFQIWCVDPMEYVNYGQVSLATITPFTASTSSPDDFAPTFAERTQMGPDHALGDLTVTHTGSPDGPSALLRYEDAAYLASEMTDANATDVENAMWCVMGYTTDHCTYGGAASYISGIDLNSPTFDFSEWGVITSGQDEQEFIYRRDDGGHFLEVTPEPATMAMMAIGLVGMAGTSIRRRKQRTL